MSKRNRIKSQANRKTKKNLHLTLSSYEPVAIEMPLLEVSKEEILEQMQETAKKFPLYVRVADRKIHTDDHLLLSMQTFKGAIPLESLTYEKQRINLSDKTMPEELKKHLLSLKVGEASTFTYDVPEPQADTAPSQALVSVTANVLLHEIQEERTPEITNEWVSRYIPGACTVEEFYSRVKRQMESKASLYSEEMKYSQCAAVLASRLESPIPDELFEQGMKSSKHEFETMLKQSNMTKEQYLQRQGVSEEELSLQFMIKGRQMVAEGMALEAMANHLELAIEDEDINAVFGDVTLLQAKNMREAYERAGKTEELQRMAYCGKALEHVVANAKITFKKVTDTPNPFESISEN